MLGRPIECPTRWVGARFLRDVETLHGMHQVAGEDASISRYRVLGVSGRICRGAIASGCTRHALISGNKACWGKLHVRCYR